MTSGSDPTGTKRPLTVFISHSGADHQLVDELRHALEQAGARVWDPEDEIPIGSHVRQGIEEGIRTSDAAVVVISDAAHTSPWSSMELATLLASNVSRSTPRIVPVLARRRAEIPPFIRDIFYADASRPATRSAAIDAVVRAVTANEPHPAPDPASLTAELTLERALLDAQRFQHSLTTTTRWKRDRRLLRIALVLSLAGLVAVSQFAGAELLQVTVPALISLLAAAFGMVLGHLADAGEPPAWRNHDD